MSQLHVVENYDALSSSVVEELTTLIKQKPNAAVCLAGGKSPIGFFETFVTRVKKIDLDISQVTFIGLDEWVGVNGETKGSCRATLNEHLFYPLNIADENIL